jgi:uncharacterized membrane protein YphA (DoxX/SURF4 family)
MKKPQDLCLLLLRIGLGGVFLYFGISHLVSPVQSTKWVPEGVAALLPNILTFIYVLGAVEVIVGLLVLIGFLTRVAASLAVVILLGIITALGFNEIMIRDTGLMFLALGLAIAGPGCHSVDEKLKK